MRRFYLRNASGEEYDLQDREKVVLIQPAGFGFDEQDTFQQIGNSFVSLDSSYSQKSITGSLVFLGADPYKTYYEFARFLSKSPLVMRYIPTDGLEYRINLKATSLEKAEVEYVDAMMTNVTFAALSAFYKTLSVYNKGEVEGGSKTYEYTYNYEYSDDVPQTVVLQSDSSLPSPVKLTIYGPATNPRWSHYVNGQIAERGLLTGTIESGHKLVIDNTTIPFKIGEYTTADTFVADRYELCDFSTERFMYTKLGTNRFSISHDGPEILPMSLETNIEYETV